LVTPACCAVLASVWHAAGDENRRQAIAAVGALEQARDSGERIEAIGRNRNYFFSLLTNYFVNCVLF
jgi:hypothetical protein